MSTSERPRYLDIGKRAYLVGGVVQVENADQRDARLRRAARLRHVSE